MLKNLFGLAGSSGPSPGDGPFHRPYADSTSNYIYNLLFCDNPGLFSTDRAATGPGPLATVLSAAPAPAEIRRLADDRTGESRVRALAYNWLRANAIAVPAKILLGTIIERPMERGLDTLAAFADGKIRYINQGGAMAIFECPAAPIRARVDALTQASQTLVDRIAAWDRPRLPAPRRGLVRMTFLVSDGLYFGEGPAAALMHDNLGGAVFLRGAELLQTVVDAARAAQPASR